MKKHMRKKREKKKSAFDLDINDLGEYLKQLPEVIFFMFMIWFGYSIINNPTKNEVYQKYLKKSLIQGRKYIDHYFPGFLSNEKIFNILDYDILLIKTKELILCFGWFYIIGALLLLIFTSRMRKFVLLLSLILDLSIIHNLIFFRDGNYFDIIKIVIYLIILICL